MSKAYPLLGLSRSSSRKHYQEEQVNIPLPPPTPAPRLAGPSGSPGTEKLRIPKSFASECQVIMPELNIREGSLISSTKHQWANQVKTAIKRKNKEDVLHKIKPYKKLNRLEMKNEEFEVKSFVKKYDSKGRTYYVLLEKFHDEAYQTQLRQ